MTRIALTALTIVLLTGCTPRSSTDDRAGADTPKLAVYETESGSAARISMALNELLSGFGDDSRTGNVSVLPNGQIAVSAPASIHPAVERLIQRMDVTAASTARTVRIRQWLIQGTPADAVAIGDRLSALGDELMQLVETAGPMRFEQLDRVEHVTVEGSRSSVQGSLLDASLWIPETADQIEIDLEIGTPMLGSLETKLGTEPGQTVVLANIQRPLGEETEAGSIVVFVIQADII